MQLPVSLCELQQYKISIFLFIFDIYIYLLCAVAEFLLAAWLHKRHKGGGGGVGCETFNKSKTIIITEI